MCSDDILECPHCGGRCKVITAHNPSERTINFRVYCQSCQCRTGPENTKKDAIRKWNLRQDKIDKN